MTRDAPSPGNGSPTRDERGSPDGPGGHRGGGAGRSLRALAADDGRGQLVLVAAGVVAVALVGVAMAYLQLGYHADVGSGYDPDPAENAERALSRAVHEAALDADGSWAEREAVIEATRGRLAPRIDAVERSRVGRGTAYAVTYNRSAARAYARERCPGGPDRQFGACLARRGVVVQERAGETHVVAVAFDLTVTTERGTTRLTLVVRAVGGPAR